MVNDSGSLGGWENQVVVFHEVNITKDNAREVLRLLRYLISQSKTLCSSNSWFGLQLEDNDLFFYV